MTCALALTTQPRGVDAALLESVDLVEQHLEVDHDTVADDRDAAGAEDAAGQQVQGVLLVADHDGVAGVVAAVELHDVVDPATEQVGGLAFALVAPLGPDDHNCRHGIAPPSTRATSPGLAGLLLMQSSGIVAAGTVTCDWRARYAATASRLPQVVLQNRRDRLRDRSRTTSSQSSAAQMLEAGELVGADHVDHRHGRLDRDAGVQRAGRPRSRAGASRCRRAVRAGAPRRRRRGCG